MKKYYKVVSLSLQSARASRNLEDFSITYKVGKWVKPHIEGSNLMVFDNLSDAIAFTEKDIGDRIYECAILNPSKTGIIFSSIYDIEQYMKKVLKLKKMKKKYKHLVRGLTPKGTIFCSAVKLIKEIKY